jgi:D-beta-D-heptose 7-phosphate kinase/D-beta-D-heptose 1-phosphate adenosyltransferase
MNEHDRLKIVQSLKCVDEAFLSIDKDESVCLSLRLCSPHIFANGGDRKEEEVPEAEVCRMLNIEMVDGLGDKIRSSSDYTGLKK